MIVFQNYKLVCTNGARHYSNHIPKIETIKTQLKSHGLTNVRTIVKTEDSSVPDIEQEQNWFQF